MLAEFFDDDADLVGGDNGAIAAAVCGGAAAFAVEGDDVALVVEGTEAKVGAFGVDLFEDAVAVAEFFGPGIVFGGAFLGLARDDDLVAAQAVAAILFE